MGSPCSTPLIPTTCSSAVSAQQPAPSPAPHPPAPHPPAPHPPAPHPSVSHPPAPHPPAPHPPAPHPPALPFLCAPPPFPDVPEGSVIIRAHTAAANLFSCLWFNEVDRFTSRDQLSFAYTYHKMARTSHPLRLNMFKDCERRSFVKLFHHKAEEAALKLERGSTQAGARQG
ncbi:unnamed protein product [Closterium sp. NIES-53]